MKQFALLGICIVLSGCASSLTGDKPVTTERRLGELNQLLANGDSTSNSARQVQSFPLDVDQKVMQSSEIEELVVRHVVPAYKGKNVKIKQSSQKKFRQLKQEDENLKKRLSFLPDDYNLTVFKLDGDFEIDRGPVDSNSRSYKHMIVISRSSDGKPISVSAYN